MAPTEPTPPRSCVASTHQNGSLTAHKWLLPPPKTVSTVPKGRGVAMGQQGTRSLAVRHGPATMQSLPSDCLLYHHWLRQSLSLKLLNQLLHVDLE